MRRGLKNGGKIILPGFTRIGVEPQRVARGGLRGRLRERERLRRIEGGL
jgi:hypothetical protein